MIDLDEDETLTAYHEAGHAVIAYVLGGTVQWLQLGGEADEWLPERFGECRIRWGRVDPACDWQLQREILTILAGPVAEMLYRGESLLLGLESTWADDWARARSMIETLTPDPDMRIRILRQMTDQLAERIRGEPCWAAIAALADELVAHETLESEKVSEILRFWIR